MALPLRVPSGNRDVIEEYATVWMPADGDDIFVEPIARASLRTAFDDEGRQTPSVGPFDLFSAVIEFNERRLGSREAFCISEIVAAR